MSNFFSRFSSASGETPKDGIYTDKPLVEPEAVKFEPHQNDEVIELPEDFECPLCGVGKDMFSEE